MMGKLDKATSSAPFMRIQRARLRKMRADPRYNFMFSGMLVADTMTACQSARLFRLPSDGRPISIIDVSGVPSDNHVGRGCCRGTVRA